MAKFSIEGVEALLEDLEKEAVRAEQLVPKMLEAGAKVLAKAHKKEAAQMIRSGKIRFFGNISRSTGDLVESIKATPVKGRGSDAYVDVYPQGTDSKKVRNAEKGFLAEYGTQTMPSYPWMSLANEKASSETVETMQEIWNEEK